jgi:UMF1 family MFS transporter
MPMDGLQRYYSLEFCSSKLTWNRFLSFAAWVCPWIRFKAATNSSGSFIPITLEQLARERGVLSSDHKTSCTAGLELSNSSSNTTMASSVPVGDALQCVVDIFGFEVNTASFAMYTFSASVFVQFLLIISMSGAADHGTHRKLLLILFSYTGAFATMLFLPISSDWIVTAALLAIVANTCYGASSVLLNSFLPLLVRNHPKAIENKLALDHSQANGDDVSDISGEENEHDQEQGDVHKPGDGQKYQASVEISISTRISSLGIGIGYIAALLLQIFLIFVVKSTGSTVFSLRLALCLVGLWWASFTLPSALWLRPRPGPALALPPTAGRLRTLLAYTTYSWKSLGRSLMRARKLKDVLLFLAAWFLLSDAVATVSGTAILFAKTSLNMQPAALALINVISTLSGIVGAFTWRRISQYMGLKPNQTVLACIVLFEIVPLYGLAGYLPFVRRWGVGGLQQGWEMYVLDLLDACY